MFIALRRFVDALVPQAKIAELPHAGDNGTSGLSEQSVLSHF
jgi:hypothetical protein